MALARNEAEMADMNDEDKNAALEATAREVMNVMPPRENPWLNKSLTYYSAKYLVPVIEQLRLY